MAQDQENQGDEFIKPSLDGSDPSIDSSDDSDSDSFDACPQCHGHGTIIVGEFDDTHEVRCPHVIREENEADMNQRVKELKENL